MHAALAESKTLILTSVLFLMAQGRLYNTFEFFNRLDNSMVINIVMLTILVSAVAWGGAVNDAGFIPMMKVAAIKVTTLYIFLQQRNTLYIVMSCHW